MTDPGSQIGRKDWSGFSDWDEWLIQLLRLRMKADPSYSPSSYSVHRRKLSYHGLRNSPSPQIGRKDLSGFWDWEEGLILVLKLGRRINPSTQIERKGWSELSSLFSEKRGRQLRLSYQDEGLLPVLQVVGRTRPSYQINYSE